MTRRAITAGQSLSFWANPTTGCPCVLTSEIGRLAVWEESVKVKETEDSIKNRGKQPWEDKGKNEQAEFKPALEVWPDHPTIETKTSYG